jgi:hypothetical protein
VALTIEQAAHAVRAIGTGLPDVAWVATNRVCRYGKTVIVAQAVDTWGADRKPSRWRKGRKTVNARYRVTGRGTRRGRDALPDRRPVLHMGPRPQRRHLPTRKTGNPKRYPAMAARPAVWTRPATSSSPAPPSCTPPNRPA